MKEHEIIQKVLNALSNIEDATAIESTDFTEERDANMIVVGIDNVTQVNVGLPDYNYRLQIVVDTFIEGDNDGSLFIDTYKEVQRIMNQYVLNDLALSDLFEEIPVVGLFFENCDFSIDDKSNRAVFEYTVITSF